MLAIHDITSDTGVGQSPRGDAMASGDGVAGGPAGSRSVDDIVRAMLTKHVVASSCSSVHGEVRQHAMNTAREIKTIYDIL